MRYTITIHAIRRYQERIDRTASDTEARDAIERLLARAYVERRLDDRTVQLRARGRGWPGRVRLRVRSGAQVSEVVTVLPEHDDWRPRTRKPRHPKGAHRGRPRERYEPGVVIGAWTIVRCLGTSDDNGALMYEVRCRCGATRVKQATTIARGKHGCRACWARRAA